MVSNHFAVITGDLVQSTSLGERRQDSLNALKKVLQQVETLKEDEKETLWVSDIFRGDSFQVVISDPSWSLKIALFVRACLMKNVTQGKSADTRMAIGIGKIESFNKQVIAESDGEAFRLSGRSLDTMLNYRRLSISSSSEELNDRFDLIAGFLDALLMRWTPEQAEAISLWLLGDTQVELSRILHISQSAVQQRLKLAGHFALTTCLRYFRKIVNNYKSQNL
jgi:hypothetical protein